MKPINIEMSAFGPYKEKIEIDFTKLGEKGIFLITGDTGAGKTSIFDAMVFALFGEVSGSNRQVSSIRSDFSEANTETYVILKFIHKGKIYTIRRTTAYERPKKSGEGLTKNIADAWIEYEDNVISGIGDVNEKVEEILGINAKQFKQISMLAQGEFLKVLFAESKDRTEIFRRIFDTDIYSNITFKLKNKRKESEEKLSNLKTAFITNSKNIRWTRNIDFVNIESEKELNQIDVKDILKRLDDDIKEKEKNEKELEEKLEKAEKEYKVIEDKYKKIEEENQKIDNLELLIKKSNDLKEQENVIKSEEKLLEINQKIKEKIKPIEELLKKNREELEKINELKDEENKKYKKLEKNEKLIIEKEEKIKKLKIKLDEYNKNLIDYNKLSEEIIKIEEINSKIEVRENLINELKKIEENKNKIEELKINLDKYQRINKEIKEINQEENKINNILEILIEKKSLEKEYNKVNKEYKNISQKYNEEEDTFFREQAGIIAEKLEENKPCPVCGSEKHPNIAHKNNIVLSKEDLEKLNEEKSLKFEENEKLKNKITEVKIKIETLEKDLSKEKGQNIEDYKKLIENKNENVNIEKNKIKEIIFNLYKEVSGKTIIIEEFCFEEYKEKFEKNRQEKLVNKKEYDIIINNFINSVRGKNNEFNIKEYSINIQQKYNKNKKLNDKLIKTVNEIYFDITEKEINLKDFIFDEFKENFDKKRKEQLEELTKSNTLINQYNKNIEDKSKELEALNKKYVESYNKLGYKTYKDYINNVINDEEILKKQEKINEYNKNVIEIKTKIEEISKSLQYKEKVDITQCKIELEEKLLLLNNVKKEHIDFKGNMKNNKIIQKLLKKNSDELLKQIELFVNYDELYKTASGTLPGKRKIEFEQYVQATYFDMIINEANKRLDKMTDNRYELIRKETSEKTKEKTGLDLEVIDNYSGKKRDVKSLSGGESFKAALALSLGVSDVIQSYSGGVVVDTLFIDEGFGSLDTESREQAINTLNLLTDNDKIIGIISHVTELKDRIDKKIIVEKTSESSKVRFEV